MIETTCRCGHILTCCADCRDWLVANQTRIQNEWGWWIRAWLEFGVHYVPKAADAAEAADRAYCGLKP